MPDRMGWDLNFGNNPRKPAEIQKRMLKTKEEYKIYPDMMPHKGISNMNTLVPTKSAYQALKERLADLKQNLLNEQRSEKPSPLYIQDLKASIKDSERMLGNNK